MDAGGIVGWEKRKKDFNTETTEEEHRGQGEKSEKRKIVSLGRKNPPFAKGAKDGAPSSLFVWWR